MIETKIKGQNRRKFFSIKYIKTVSNTKMPSAATPKQLSYKCFVVRMLQAMSHYFPLLFIAPEGQQNKVHCKSDSKAYASKGVKRMRKSEIINTRKHFVPAMHSPSCCH
jgi:hypothetical protein